MLSHQGTSGNVPLAAAFTVVPMVDHGGLPRRRAAPRSLRCALSAAARADALAASRLARARRRRCCFLHLPLALIVLYAFTTEDASFTFPPPGLTTRWFGGGLGARRLLAGAGALARRWRRWPPRSRSVLGTLAAAAVWRSRFFGREAISLLLILPIALPGIVTGIALRSALSLAGIPFSFWTIVVGHATFCIVVVYNNALARFRRTSALADRGLDGPRRRRLPDLPPRACCRNIATALLAGGMLAFALSFDEVIVTTFTAGQQETLPIWIFTQLARPRQRPVTNVVAVFVILVTLVPDPARLLPDARHPRGDGKRKVRTMPMLETTLLIGGDLVRGEGAEEPVIDPATGPD